MTVYFKKSERCKPLVTPPEAESINFNLEDAPPVLDETKNEGQNTETETEGPFLGKKSPRRAKKWKM